METGGALMKWMLSLIGLIAGALQASATEAPPAFTADGYRVPQPFAPLEFPRDHASHPGFKIEWWYLTGHLFATDGRRFGYQATFFRTALKPPLEQAQSPFGSSQLYLTHMALTDERDGRFYFEQRLAREGWDACSSTDALDVRNGNWKLQSTTPDVSEMLLQASVESEVAWSLTLRPAKPLIRFGEDGTSRKGADPEARSYYLTFPRLATSGTVTIGNETLAVTGMSWMDHEIASNQLDPGLAGWDWIAIQLEDGWDLKAYILRNADGTPSPFSALIWIDPQGNTRYHNVGDFQWDKSDTWQSPETGARYPNRPVITTRHPLSGEPASFHFDPILENQELNLPGTTYWEGAGRILNESGDRIGSAYLELVGYAGKIEGLR
jgi:predicted secreted hydrolase